MEKLSIQDGAKNAISNAASTTIKSAPKRFIYGEKDMDCFRASSAKKALLAFATALGQSCIPSSAKMQYKYNPSNPLKGLNPGMASLYGSLQAISELWLTEPYFPPDVSGGARFGNPIFRTWHNHLVANVSTKIVIEILDCHLDYFDIYQTIIQSNNSDDISMKEDLLNKCRKRGYDAAAVLPEHKNTKESSVPQKQTENTLKDGKRQHLLINLLPYLHSSFGHPTRLDYGTGHESSFLIFLFILYQMGPLAGNTSGSKSPMKIQFPLPEVMKTTLAPVALSIFSQYLQVMRGLQTKYMLEPAGSHGVWGLDDYHCLPFYFGACQLISNDDNSSTQHADTPASIHDKYVLQSQSKENLYYGCILYIQSIKKGVPFGESSPMLNDISYLKSWEKVAKGLLKLYEGEVLDKRQVVQHFVFGDFFQGESNK